MLASSVEAFLSVHFASKPGFPGRLKQLALLPIEAPDKSAAVFNAISPCFLDDGDPRLDQLGNPKANGLVWAV